MYSRLRFLPATLLAAVLTTAPAAFAQDTPSAATVVAKVGETEITLGHMLALRSGLPQHYNQLEDDVLFKGILDQLVQQTLLMQMVEEEPELLTELMVENERRAIYAQQAIRGVLDKPIDEATIEAAYAERFADVDPEPEYHAAHILVETEEEAKEIANELAEGADFAETAKARSTGPSGPSGGDLGWFGPGVMVEPFFQAVQALEAGAVSEPIQTQFGWHLIKLIETRTPEKPALEEVRETLLEELREKAFNTLLTEREAETKIDRSGAEAIDTSIIKTTDILEN